MIDDVVSRNDGQKKLCLRHLTDLRSRPTYEEREVNTILSRQPISSFEGHPMIRFPAVISPAGSPVRLQSAISHRYR